MISEIKPRLETNNIFTIIAVSILPVKYRLRHFISASKIRY